MLPSVRRLGNRSLYIWDRVILLALMRMMVILIAVMRNQCSEIGKVWHL